MGASQSTLSRCVLESAFKSLVALKSIPYICRKKTEITCVCMKLLGLCKIPLLMGSAKSLKASKFFNKVSSVVASWSSPISERLKCAYVCIKLLKAPRGFKNQPHIFMKKHQNMSDSRTKFYKVVKKTVWRKMFSHAILFKMFTSIILLNVCTIYTLHMLVKTH